MTPPDQDAAIAACDETLKAVNLPTYTQVEERMSMSYIAALDALEMGKQLCKKLDAAEREIKRLKK